MRNIRKMKLSTFVKIFWTILSQSRGLGCKQCSGGVSLEPQILSLHKKLPSLPLHFSGVPDYRIAKKGPSLEQ